MGSDWRAWRGCLEGVGRLFWGCGRLSVGCEEAVWMLWRICLQGVWRLFGMCGEAI